MPLAAPHAPRQPTSTPLHRIVHTSLETFLERSREMYCKPIPRYVEQECLVAERPKEEKPAAGGHAGHGPGDF